jgi:hypothetical protein
MTEQSATEFSLAPAEQRLQALLEAAQRWIDEQSLILPEIEYILRNSRKIVYLYRDRPTAEKLPAPLRTPYELMVWARPERGEGDLSGLEQYAHWFARWLLLCMPGEEDLQDEVCCQSLIRAQSRAQMFVY